jgi:glycosyltransferase involved in cell wall biosynthesis
MKLLMSVYACAPDHGSEHAIGWNWVTQAHRAGHEVWAFASTVNRGKIEAACDRDPDLRGINWIYPEIPFWPIKAGIEPKWERTYNLLWQIEALRKARQLHTNIGFDAIHHLTWGGIRAMTFLGMLDAPLIIGPTGGGETSPMLLRRDLHLRARITEWIRDFSSATVSINPLTASGLKRASMIFAKTPDTANLFPPAIRRKVEVFLELGLAPHQIGSPKKELSANPRLMFAGRLLYWKGGHIAIQAFAELLRMMPHASLTVVGKGPEQQRLTQYVNMLGIAKQVTFVQWLPQSEFFKQLQEHDLFVFPSLHDSSGGVVLESLAHGTPVVCLDVGGPKEIVTSDCGLIIPTNQKETSAVAKDMAAQMAALLSSPGRYRMASQSAIERASQFLVEGRVRDFYHKVAKRGLGTSQPITHDVGCVATNQVETATT